jgi:hypothetical protein
MDCDGHQVVDNFEEQYKTLFPSANVAEKNILILVVEKKII